MELEEAIEKLSAEMVEYSNIAENVLEGKGKVAEDCREYVGAINVVLNHLTKQEKMIHKAYAKANNYLYFNDSSDYEVGLWEVIRSLKPDLAEKWDNGDCEPLEYIEEESE